MHKPQSSLLTRPDKQVLRLFKAAPFVRFMFGGEDWFSSGRNLGGKKTAQVHRIVRRNIKGIHKRNNPKVHPLQSRFFPEFPQSPLRRMLPPFECSTDELPDPRVQRFVCSPAKQQVLWTIRFPTEDADFNNITDDGGQMVSSLDGGSSGIRLIVFGSSIALIERSPRE